MWRTRLEAVRVGPIGRELADWVIARHNFIVEQSPNEEIDEAGIERLHDQEQKARHLLAKAGENGALDEILQQALFELHQRKTELRTMSPAAAQAIEQSAWSPMEGFLPDEFDMIVGKSDKRRRYVGLGDGKWAQIPLDMSEESVDKLRQETSAGETHSQAPEGDHEAALMHAMHCLFEAFASHLGRFAMGVGPNKETPHWSVSQEVLGEHHGRPATHELVGLVASGNVSPAQFLDDEFLNLLANRCDADKRDVRLVGALQLPSALQMIQAPQAMRDLSWCVGKRMAEGKDPLDFKDPDMAAARRAMGLAMPEHFRDREDHTLLIFSVVRYPSEHQALFGTSDDHDSEQMGMDETWIEQISAWADTHGMEGTYVMPPTTPLEAVARLGAVHVASIGQEGEMTTAAGLGQDGAVDWMAPIDVVGFDEDNIPIARTQLPAWMFGLIEEALGDQLHELFQVRLDVLPSDHGLDLDLISDIREGREAQDPTPAPPTSKRTLH